MQLAQAMIRNCRQEVVECMITQANWCCENSKKRRAGQVDGIEQLLDGCQLSTIILITVRCQGSHLVDDGDSCPNDVPVEEPRER